MFEHLVRSTVKDVPEYSAGKSVEEAQKEYGLKSFFKLASNENQWGPSPKAMAAIEKEIPNSNFYPERTNLALRQVLAKRFGISEDMIVTAAGGGAVVELALQTFVDPNEEVVMAKETFQIYRSNTKMINGIPIEIPLKDSTHDLEAMAKAVGSRTKAVIICNPNNPTGTLVGHAALKDFLNSLPDSVVVIIDEVYIDFASGPDIPDSLYFIHAGKPVIAIRTFSKLYGLAGLRVGFGMAPAEIIRYMNRVRKPFGVNRLANVAALGALEDEEHRKFIIAETIKGRNLLSKGLKDMGLQCIPSQGSFLFVNLGVDAQEVFEKLMAKGIIIRVMGRYGANWVRITVGTEEQNNKLLLSLKEILAEKII